MTDTLKQLGAESGVKVGFSATMTGIEYAPAPLMDFFQANFNLLTPANELKWSVVQPTQGVYEFAEADYLLAFAQKNGMAFRGHHLCCNTNNPAWLAEVLTKDNAEGILLNYIHTVAGRYAGKIDSWDVVNEPIAVWDDQPNGLSPGPWLTALGEEYIDIAFHAAAATDPLALRVLNLNHTEEASDATAKQASLALLERLLQRNVPVQAVGMESHIDCGLSIDAALLESFIKSIRSMGLEILFTEFDVNDSKINGTFAKRDQIVADYYENYLDIALPAADANRIVFWSPTDNSWMDALCEDKDPEFERSDGLCDHRPGLINSSWQLKPAYYAVAAALEKYAETHYAAAGQAARWSRA
jgi:endo-1,4-beta-xylanase